MAVADGIQFILFTRTSLVHILCPKAPKAQSRKQSGVILSIFILPSTGQWALGRHQNASPLSPNSRYQPCGFGIDIDIVIY